MKRLICLICMLLLLCGCSEAEPVQQETLFAMDTVMDLKLWGPDAGQGIEQIKALIQSLDADWTASDPDSLIGQMNRGLETVLTAQQAELLDRIEALSVRTGGCFNPRLYSVIDAWGFYDQGYRVPEQHQLAEALAAPKLDLGAAIKGYAGQQAAALLQGLDIDRALLNFGGNIQTYGKKSDGTPWNIGIQDPRGSGSIGTVSVTGTASIVTSGDYQRYFEADGVRYHHIFAPGTGRPAETGLASVTVICRDGLTADALSTALFVMGLEEAAEFWRQSTDFEAVFILDSGEVYATQGAELSGCEYEVIYREK